MTNVYRVGTVTKYDTAAYSFGTIAATTVQNYTITAESNGFGLAKVYVSQISTATSGNAALSVPKGTTVYGFAVLATDTSSSFTSG